MAGGGVKPGFSLGETDPYGYNITAALSAGGYDGMLCVEIDFLKDPRADEAKSVEDAVNYLRTLVGNP